ncbi:MAG: hypothetical protein RSG23_05080 [Gordonibacter sp.]|uniref:Lar family restriction alleviation protein n=1 Tax=Gordonibacter sp. TaxID=1968902 RepID=UPI002FC8E093
MKIDVGEIGLETDPCPFCGGEWSTSVSETGCGYMSCATCRRCGAMLFGENETTAIRAVVSLVVKVNSRAAGTNADQV